MCIRDRYLFNPLLEDSMVRIIRIFAVMLILLAGVDLFAGPTIIRDKRIQDLALTPTLGRGYTIVTNTFQSKCMDNVVVTDPTYDFQYKFESIESSKSIQAGASATAGAAGSIKGVDINASSKFTYASGKKEFYHHIYVEINMDTYYASVDEARTRLSSSAAQLLSNNDIPGFFSSCGSYYVRSLGRNAKFVSVFTYTDVSETRDAAFEASLEIGIKSFGSVTAGTSSSLNQQAGEKKLTITAQAWGLGKNEGATLISYDLETFRAAIKDAFISMQNPMTGKVTTMEIVPWVENTEFQNLIKLEKEVVDPKTGKTMLLYKKKQVLNENAEYLAEIERADRNMMNIYYKGKICRQTIDANWVKDGKLHPEFENARVVNNKFPSETMTLKQLNDLVSNASIEKIIQEEEKFMYASGGANECLNALLDSGMYVKSYRDIDVCKKLRTKLSMVINENVDNYCMPQLAKPPKTPEKEPVKKEGASTAGGNTPAN